jgi:multidrug resistance efflux pump
MNEFDHKDQTIAALRAQLKQAEEERDRAMRAADGARERATRWQETAECEADGLEHWKSACESSKAALAAKEAELDRYKQIVGKMRERTLNRPPGVIIPMWVHDALEEAEAIRLANAPESGKETT